MAHLTIPNDVQVAPAGEAPYAATGPATNKPTAPVCLAAPGLPRREHLQSAADVLNAGKRPVMLVGAGALHARDEVLAVAEALGSPIVKTLPGKAVVPDNHPLTTGGIGLLGTRPSEDALEGCDTLLMAGTNFPYTKYLPASGQARVVQVEQDPVRAGNRIATEVPLVGDAKETLAALLPLIRTNEDRSFLTTAQASMVKWRSRMMALESADTDPIQPQRLMKAVDNAAADDAVLTCDSGTIATWAARDFDIKGDRQFYLSGNLATMAPGLPYAIGIQRAFPDRQVIAFVGDGGFAMLMAELATAARYRLPIKVVICNNAELGQIQWEQMVLGYPSSGSGSRSRGGLRRLGHRLRRLRGQGRRAEEGRGRHQGRAGLNGPAIVDIDVDPNEPPLPGKVAYDQAKKFAKAFLKGQPKGRHRDDPVQGQNRAAQEVTSARHTHLSVPRRS